MKRPRRIGFVRRRRKKRRRKGGEGGRLVPAECLAASVRPRGPGSEPRPVGSPRSRYRRGGAEGGRKGGREAM